MGKVVYSSALCAALTGRIRMGGLHVRYRPRRYEPGDVLNLALTMAWPEFQGHGRFRIDKFAGGGFAGQVYRCVLESIALETPAESASGLVAGGVYAVKILVPPSRFSTCFRNAVYWLGFQAPFGAQVLESATRTGLLWPKVLRHVCAQRFGDVNAVADTYASFYDENFGAFGEVREWVEGRTWRLESDVHLEKRKHWREVDPCDTDSPEYVAKRQFMARLVALLHELGAYELARQYEWTTLKSQPNVLKRHGSGNDPAAGLCAVDFRAGLALLPFLPMSPGDFKLIFAGLRRGALAQFDRCDFRRLHAYAAAHPDVFAGHEGMLEALERYDRQYRRAMPDVTHQGWRLLADHELRGDVRSGLIAGYRANGLVDDAFARTLQAGGWRFFAFYLLGAFPFAGRLLRRLWGDPAYRGHVAALWSNLGYLRRASRVNAAAAAIDWHRAGRIGEAQARQVADHMALYWAERLTVGLLPAFLHRWLTEPMWLWARVRAGFGYVAQFLGESSFREQWLRDQIEEGLREGMLLEDEAVSILARIEDPFIAKYLKSVGVHLAFLPVTQIFSVTIGAVVAIRVYMVTQDKSAAGAAFAGVMLFFQFVPISPGSICRGLYVVYLMIRERNFQDYMVAAPISFVKYVGYLAFPLQMATAYPALSQFMAGRWATSAVHIIPVFGEKGALTEHFVFDFFYNRPRRVARWLSRRSKGLLTLWMIAGLAVAGYLLGVRGVDWQTPQGIKSGFNIVITVLCVFVLPRSLFHPMLKRGTRR